MLGPELVRARRRGDKLELLRFPAAERARALEIAGELILLLQGQEGAPFDEVQEALGAVDREAREEKCWAGLKKLLLDEASFGAPVDEDPVLLRRLVFERASAARRDAEPGLEFRREAVLDELAAERGLERAVLEEALFSDLKGAARLTRVPRVTPEVLVERYELAQIQGVLLRAVRLVATVRVRRPEDYRALFHKLKFRQLLYAVSELEDGRYRLTIDGPFSMFESVTKYGLQLALLVPTLHTCEEVELEAEVRWGKERKPLQFRTVLGNKELTDEIAAARPEIEQLLEALEKKGGPWRARPAETLLDVPGVGLCVPDLIFEAPGRPSVHLELLGYWSRDAVWKRLEWAEKAPDRRVVFAVSSRLRVSEDVVPDDSSSALYVFKGTLSARAVLERVEALAAR